MEEEFRLYGDDFDQDAIRQWFWEEAEYHNQFQQGRFREPPQLYQRFDWYWVLNPYFQPRTGAKVLDFGCAEGQALIGLPAERRDFAYVGVDASESLLKAARARNPRGEFRRMPDDGRIPAADEEFDYVVVLGVLHHVPNVRHYLEEFHRILRPGGRLILREPNHAMGRPVGSHRILPGLSPNERGIPTEYLTQQLTRLQMRIVAVRPAFHGLVVKLLRRWKPDSPRGWQAVIGVDRILNGLTRGRARYERTRLWDKIAPTASYVVADKGP